MLKLILILFVVGIMNSSTINPTKKLVLNKTIVDSMLIILLIYVWTL